VARGRADNRGGPHGTGRQAGRSELVRRYGGVSAGARCERQGRDGGCLRSRAVKATQRKLFSTLRHIDS
jgi:hypothetical protein